MIKFLLIFTAIASIAAAKDELLVFLIDTSGSMAGQEVDIVNGVNKVMEDMFAQYQKFTHTNGTFSVQIWTFSERERRLLTEAPLQTVPKIAFEQYRPSGGTPLMDAIGDTLKNVPNGSTIIIATDGEDTTSSRYTLKDVKEMIADAKEKRDIQFIFVAKGTEAFSGGARLGLDKDSVYKGPITDKFNIAIGYSAASTSGRIQVSACGILIGTGAFRHLEVGKIDIAIGGEQLPDGRIAIGQYPDEKN
jgi:hypothetical protein